MIKIVHIINSLDQGGAEMMLYKFIKNSEGKKIKNVVFCLKKNGLMSHDFKKLKIKVVHIKINNLLNLLKSINNTFKLISELQPPIVMSWLHVSDLIGTLIKIRFPNIKLIWNLRCSAPEIRILGLRNWLLVKFLSFFSKVPDCIIANSRHGLESHMKIGYKPLRKKVIHNGFEIQNVINLNDNRNFRRFHNIKNEFLIGYIGKKSKIKGIDLFIRSAKIINQKIKNIKFVFVGKDLSLENKCLLNSLRKGNLLASSILLGEVKHAKKIINNFDLLALTSRSEGFPNVLGEAMNSSVPCVATNVGDCKQIIGCTGIIVNTLEPKDIVEGWKKIYFMSPKKRKDLGKKGRDRIVKNFSMNMVVNDYINLIYEIINEKK